MCCVRCLRDGDGDYSVVTRVVGGGACLRQNDLPTEEGMSFLQVKNHALLAYTKLELFFALLKVRHIITSGSAALLTY